MITDAVGQGVKRKVWIGVVSLVPRGLYLDANCI